MKTPAEFEVGKIYTASEYYKPAPGHFRELRYTVTGRTAKYVTVVEDVYATEHRLYVRTFQGVEELWAPARWSHKSGNTLTADRHL